MMATPRREMPPLRAWQRAALTRWRANQRRGIIAAATGTGKTRLAVAAVAELDAGVRTAIVVPTRALQSQWVRALQTGLGLRSEAVGTMGGDNPDLTVDHRLVVAVINSAADRLPAMTEYWASQGDPTLLIVDECHWAGSRSTAERLFSSEYRYTLGLSATPERGDDGLDEYLVPNLGDVVFRYTLRDAMDDGILSELVAANLFIDLDGIELSEYRDIQQRIDALLESGAEEGASAVVGLRDRQRRVLRRAGGRHVALRALVSGGLLDGRRSLIFHESIEQAEATTHLLREFGVPHAVEHSRISGPNRASALRRFSSGAVPTLVTVRTLDEGIDVPQANTSIIVSGTMNPRQRIQRVGRIVRPAGGTGLVVTLLARGTTEETVVGDHDPLLFGRDRVLQLRRWSIQDPASTVSFLRSQVIDR